MTRKSEKVTMVSAKIHFFQTRREIIAKFNVLSKDNMDSVDNNIRK